MGVHFNCHRTQWAFNLPHTNKNRNRESAKCCPSLSVRPCWLPAEPPLTAFKPDKRRSLTTRSTETQNMVLHLHPHTVLLPLHTVPLPPPMRPVPLQQPLHTVLLKLPMELPPPATEQPMKRKRVLTLPLSSFPFWPKLAFPFYSPHMSR